MTVKTTMNIDKKILERINEVSNDLGKTRSEIIVLLLMKVMSHDTKKAAPGPVKYQSREGVEMWHKFHVSFKEDEYEFFTDLRKILKMSLSRILAFAVKQYIYEIVKGEEGDNYHFKSYVIAKECIDGIVHWKIFWGLPRNVEKYIKL